MVSVRAIRAPAIDQGVMTGVVMTSAMVVERVGAGTIGLSAPPIKGSTMVHPFPMTLVPRTSTSSPVRNFKVFQTSWVIASLGTS